MISDESDRPHALCALKHVRYETLAWDYNQRSASGRLAFHSPAQYVPRNFLENIETTCIPVQVFPAGRRVHRFLLLVGGAASSQVNDAVLWKPSDPGVITGAIS